MTQAPLRLSGSPVGPPCRPSLVPASLLSVHLLQGQRAGMPVLGTPSATNKKHGHGACSSPWQHALLLPTSSPTDESKTPREPGERALLRGLRQRTL